MNGIVWFVLIGLATGLPARTLMRGERFGVLGDALVGVLGVALGMLLFRITIDDPEAFWALAAVAAGGGALLALDLRLIQKSIAERSMPLAFLRRGPPGLKRAPLLTRPPKAALEPCRVCGQRHRMERSHA